MSIIMISSLLIFFFCLPIHTCHARHLGVLDNDKAAAPPKKLLFPSKVLESTVELKRSKPISVDVEGDHDDDEIAFHESHATQRVEDVVKPKDQADNLVKEAEQNREILSSSVNTVPTKLKPLVSVSGSVARMNYDERRFAKCKPSSHVGLLRATSVEGSRRRGLYVVEHESHVKGGKHNKALQAEEDASDMDYDPPHQKPPIHNRQT